MDSVISYQPPMFAASHFNRRMCKIVFHSLLSFNTHHTMIICLSPIPMLWHVGHSRRRFGSPKNVGLPPPLWLLQTKWRNCHPMNTVDTMIDVPSMLYRHYWQSCLISASKNGTCHGCGVGSGCK